jgi:hypothetical protein
VEPTKYIQFSWKTSTQETIPPPSHTFLSLPPEMCDRPDQEAHYHIPSSLSQLLAGHKEKKQSF